VSTLVATDVARRGLDVDGHHARHQLRPARGGGRLHAPRRPHRPRRPRRHRHHARAARSSRADVSASRACRATPRASRQSGMTLARPEARLHLAARRRARSGRKRR
jgi:hypothetical protein